MGELGSEERSEGRREGGRREVSEGVSEDKTVEIKKR